MAQIVEITGCLKHLSVYSGRWGRGFLSLTPAQAQELGTLRNETTFQGVTVTGASLVGLNEETDYRMRGRIVDHPQYGRQIEVDSVSVELPPRPEALKRYLQRNIRGVGDITATKIVAHYAQDDKLEELRDLLLNNPLSLDIQAVLGSKKPRQIALKGTSDQGIEIFIHRDLAIRLGAEYVPDSVLRKIGVWLAARLQNPTSPDAVTRAWEIFTADPYRPMLDISGYGFVAADLIGDRLGVSKDAPCRLAAMALTAVTQGCDMNGHVFLEWEQFVKAIETIDVLADPDAAVDAAIGRGWPLLVEGGRPGRVYQAKYHFAQHRLAMQLKAMTAACLRPLYSGQNLDADISAMERRMSTLQAEAARKAGRPIPGAFSLDASQREALRGLLTSDRQLHTLTAGPGCGKTAIMELLVGVLGRTRVGVFCAPTGKAAKVLSGRLSRYSQSAKTIHSTLGVKEDGFLHDENSQLFADYVVVDESSMIDLELAGHLLAAIPKRCHVIFLGDANQLPSVGPGQVLADLMRLDFDHHQLTTTHRNDGGILDVVNQAAAGQMTITDQWPDVTFSHGLAEASDESIAPILLQYERAVAEHGIDQVALLCARRKGNIETPGWNTTYLNELLRKRMNPEGERIRGIRLHIGDRVVVRKNLTLVQQEAKEGVPAIVESVVNGDTGRVDSTIFGKKEHEPEFISVRLDDGRLVRFDMDSAGALSLAYAMTVHMSQGSEYAEVLFVLTGGVPSFVHRGIVFTAMSRAKKMLRVFAEDRNVHSIVKRPIPPRNSALIEMVGAARRAQAAPAQPVAAPERVPDALGFLDW
jgi:exodeoxyribonuclease V alpha subunit